MPNYYTVIWVKPEPLTGAANPTITNTETGEVGVFPKPTDPICDICSKLWGFNPALPKDTLVASLEDLYAVQTYVPTGREQTAKPPWAACPQCCERLGLIEGETRIEQGLVNALMFSHLGGDPNWKFRFYQGS